MVNRALKSGFGPVHRLLRKYDSKMVTTTPQTTVRCIISIQGPNSASSAAPGLETTLNAKSGPVCLHAESALCEAGLPIRHHLDG